MSDVKECTTLSAARECVSFERVKSVNWQKGRWVMGKEGDAEAEGTHFPLDPDLAG